MPIAESGAVLKLRRSRGWCARTGLEVSAVVFHHLLSDARMRPLNLGACLLGMPSVLQAASPRSTKPLFTARRPSLDADEHSFRRFAGDRISQKKIKARFESVVCSTPSSGSGAPGCTPARRAPSSSQTPRLPAKRAAPRPPSPRSHRESHGLDAKTRPLLRLLQ